MIGPWVVVALMSSASNARPVAEVLAEAEALLAQNETKGDAAAARKASERFQEVIDRCPDAPEIAARAWNGLGEARYGLGDVKGTREAMERALELQRCAGGKAGLAKALRQLATIQVTTGEFAAATRHASEALERLRELGDVGGQADTLMALAAVQHRTGDRPNALELYGQGAGSA